MTGQRNSACWCRHYCYFLVQQSRLFAPLMSGYSITGALKLIELSSVRARFAAIFPQRAGICRIKYPICTQPWVGGLNSMSDMWWTGGLQDGLLLNPVNVIQYHQAGEEKECQEYKRNPFIKDLHRTPSPPHTCYGFFEWPLKSVSVATNVKFTLKFRQLSLYLGHFYP